MLHRIASLHLSNENNFFVSHRVGIVFTFTRISPVGTICSHVDKFMVLIHISIRLLFDMALQMPAGGATLKLQ